MDVSRKKTVLLRWSSNPGRRINSVRLVQSALCDIEVSVRILVSRMSRIYADHVPRAPRKLRPNGSVVIGPARADRPGDAACERPIETIRTRLACAPVGSRT